MAVSGGGGALGRRWRRFRHRPVGTQIGVLAVVVVVIVGVVVAVVASGSGGSNSNKNSAQATGGKTTSVDDASTSSRGVVGDTINVVFPISNLTQLSGTLGFAGDAEFAQQKNAIHTFVNAVNANGGINGRKINPMIENYDPTNETLMRSLCKQWTNGSPPVFAVVEGIGSWTGDNQLCITQEGHTPFIGAWTTVTDWTNQGSPYLWWTGPDQAAILRTLVSWGQSAGLLGHGRKVAVVVGDRSSDQTALNSYLLPDMKNAGLPTPMVETIPAETSEQSATTAQAPLIVQRLKAAGVQSVIPLAPFNAMFPYLQSETQDNYFPKLLLSDYESSINYTLGLIPQPYEKALDGQEGITVQTLGGTDAPLPQSKGGYDAGVKACYKTWHAANPKPIPGQTLIHNEKPSPYIESQGPIAGWCQEIKLFADAATKAGHDLNRRTFVQAMSKIENFKGTWTPTLSFGPDKFYGPTQYQVVRLHNNVPPSSACVLTYQGKTQGTCWEVVQHWKPLVQPS
jgi:hypothetical protein